MKEDEAALNWIAAATIEAVEIQVKRMFEPTEFEPDTDLYRMISFGKTSFCKMK